MVSKSDVDNEWENKKAEDYNREYNLLDLMNLRNQVIVSALFDEEKTSTGKDIA